MMYMYFFTEMTGGIIKENTRMLKHVCKYFGDFVGRARRVGLELDEIFKYAYSIYMLHGGQDR